MRKTSEELMEIQREFEQFNEQPLNVNRKGLSHLINHMIQKEGFTRRDVKDTVTLSYYGEPSMQPDITIQIIDGVIDINLDIFWKTIYGKLEEEQERQGHMRDY